MQHINAALILSSNLLYLCKNMALTRCFRSFFYLVWWNSIISQACRHSVIISGLEAGKENQSVFSYRPISME